MLADEKRRVVVRRFADARKPPTGESRASGGPSIPAATRATSGPRKPTATTRKSAVISDVAAAVSGAPVVAETANSGAAPASATSPPITRPGPSSRGSTAASVSAWVGGTRAARRPAASTASSAAATPPPTAAAIGSQPALTVRSGGAMPWRTSPSASARPSIDPGPEPGRRADQADDRRLPRDHAADLAGRRGHRAQERDLALALLDRQAHRAGHDEDRDEQRQPAERRGDGDQRGPRLLELGMLGLAAGAPGEHHRAARGGAQARGVEARPGEHADRVDPARMSGQPRRLVVGQEDRRLLPDGMAGPGDADHGDGAGGLGGRERSFAPSAAR